MAIADDIALDYNNRKIHRKATAGSTVYTVQELYSFIQDEMDESNQMDDTIPMSAQTSTAYTLINSWWLDIGDGSEIHKYLKTGAIKTDGYDASSFGNGIRLLKFQSSGYSTVSSSDIGKEVGYSGGSPADTGTLIGYNNTLRYWWVRVDDTGDTFANTGTALDLDDSGSYGYLDAASITGEELFGNVYTLGSIQTNPQAQIYIFQDGERIAEWSTNTNWDRTGHIDVVVQVKEMGVDIDSNNVTVFCRAMGDLFDHFTVQLTVAGQNAAPLATQPDLNDTDGDYYLMYNNEQTPGIQEGDVIEGNTSGAYAEVVTNTEWGTDGLLLLRGVNGAFVDGEYLYVGATYIGDVNGTLGDTYGTWSAESAGPVPGDLGKILTGGTSGAKRILRAYQDDGSTGKFVCQVSTSVTGTNRDPYYDDFDSGEAISAVGDGGTMNVTSGQASVTQAAGFSDITVAFVNGTATYSGGSGTFTEGERCTITGGDYAIFLYDNGSDTVTLGNCTTTSLNGTTLTGEISGATKTMNSDLSSAHTMSKNFTQQSSFNYDVIIQCGDIYHEGRSLADVYRYLKFICRDGESFSMYTVVTAVITILEGQEYIQAYTGYTPSKQAPFGTFAGGTIYGAQGVWLEGMASTDANNLQVIDSDGTTHTPYTTVTINISNTVAGDRVTVFLDDGSGSVDKDTYNSHDSNNSAGDSTFEIEENIPTDTPADGIIRVVDVTAEVEHRYRYASWTGKIFTLVTEITSTTSADGGSNTLIDSGASFLSADIEYGDPVRNTTDGSYAYVLSVDNDNQITTTPLTGGGDNTWQSGDTYSFHTLIATYANGDTVYVPYLDVETSGSSAQKNILYNTNRNVIVRVRHADLPANDGILPFETTGTIDSGGLSVATIRNPDNIFQTV